MTEQNGSGYEEETGNLGQQNYAQELYICINNTPKPLGSPLPSFPHSPLPISQPSTPGA